MNQQIKENGLLSQGWKKLKTKPVYIIESPKDSGNGDTRYF